MHVNGLHWSTPKACEHGKMFYRRMLGTPYKKLSRTRTRIMTAEVYALVWQWIRGEGANILNRNTPVVNQVNDQSSF